MDLEYPNSLPCDRSSWYVLKCFHFELSWRLWWCQTVSYICSSCRKVALRYSESVLWFNGLGDCISCKSSWFKRSCGHRDLWFVRYLECDTIKGWNIYHFKSFVTGTPRRSLVRFQKIRLRNYKIICLKLSVSKWVKRASRKHKHDSL